MRKLLTIASLFFVVGSFNPCLAQGAPSADEYAVYATLFRRQGADRQGAQLVIDDMTGIAELRQEHYFDPKHPEPAIQNLQKFIPQLNRETALDFLTKNQTSWTLKNEFNLKAEVIIVNSYETRRLFDQRDIEEGWKLFHKKYPNAGSIDTLSRVGFNESKTQALIYYGYVCGGLCGQGQYILLTRTDDKWTIEKECLTWIS